MPHAIVRSAEKPPTGQEAAEVRRMAGKAARVYQAPGRR
jgi:hypothetical protein